jgi:hypothetical protein
MICGISNGQIQTEGDQFSLTLSHSPKGLCRNRGPGGRDSQVPKS